MKRKACAKYSEKHTIQAAMDKFHMTRGQVNTCRAKYGYTKPKSFQIEALANAVSAVKGGMDEVEAASTFKVHRMSVRTKMRELDQEAKGSEPFGNCQLHPALMLGLST